MAFTIRQRNGLFYFRSRVPVGLRKRFGRHEIVRALQARNRSEANLIAALVALAVETAFVTIENNPALDIQEANAVLAAHLTHAQGIFVAARHGLQPASPPVVDDLTSPASASAALLGAAKAANQLIATKNSGEGSAASLATTMGFSSRAAMVPAIQQAACSQYALQLGLRAAAIAAAHPDAPALPPMVISASSIPARVMKIVSRFKDGDRVGDFLDDEDIRLIINDGLQADDPLREAAIEEERVRAFAKQRVGALLRVPDEPSGQAMSMLVSHLNLGAPEGNVEQNAPPTPAAQPAAIAGSVITATAVGVPIPFRPDSVPPVDPLTGAILPAWTLKIPDVWDRFVFEKVHTNSDWTPDVGEQAASTLKLLIAHLGPDIYVWQLTKAKLRDLRTVFRRLPSFYGKKREWIDLAQAGGLSAVADAFALRDGENAEEKGTEKKTWNRHASNIEGFRQWAWSSLFSQDGEAPSAGLHLKVTKTKLSTRSEEEIAKKLYSDEELSRLFSSEIFTDPSFDTDGRLLEPSLYFGPLMLADMGLRREEAFQLRVRHIGFETVEGETVVYVNLKDDPTLKLKTPASRRYVPLHDDLLSLGFVEHLLKGREQDDMLFGDLDPNARCHGDAPAKAFTRATAHLGIGGELMRRFRANFVTRLYRAGVAQDRIQMLIGHYFQVLDPNELNSPERGIETIHQYNAGLLRLQLKRLINRLRLPIDITRLATYRGQGTP